MSFSFTVDEIGDLCSSTEALKWLESNLLCDPNLFQEAIHALCSHLTRAKDLSSPHKRTKLRANKVYFAKLSGYANKNVLHPTRMFIPSSTGGGSPNHSTISSSSATTFNLNSSFLSSSSGGVNSVVVASSSSSAAQQPHTHEVKGISPPKSSLYGAPPPTSPLFHEFHPETPEIECSALDFSRALSGQSARWAAVPPDEVMSVALLIDSGDSTGDGVVTLEDFLAFSARIDGRMAELRGETMTNEVYAMLYEDLVRERLGHADRALAAAVAPDVYQRLTAQELTTRLRRCATAARSKQLNPLTSLMQILSTGVPSSRLETVLSLFRTMGVHVTGDENSEAFKAKAALAAAADLHIYRHALAARAEAAMSQAARSSGGRGRIGNTSLDASFNSSVSSISPRGGGSSSSSSSGGGGNNNNNNNNRGGEVGGGELQEDLVKLRANATSLAAKLAQQADGLDATMGIWAALQTLETQLKQRASEPGAGGVVDAIPSPSPAKQAGASKGKDKGKDKGKKGVANGTFASPRGPSSSSSSPRAGAGAGAGAGLDQTIARNGSLVSMNISLGSLSAPPAGSAGGSSPRGSGGSSPRSARAGGGGGASPRARTRLSINTDLDDTPASSRPGSASAAATGSHNRATGVLAQRALERSQSRSGRPPQTPLPFATKDTRPQPTRAAAPLSSSSPSPSPRHATHTSRSTIPPSRANMSIFKSPGRRQASENVNVYNPDSLLWVPTAVSGKYNSRFATTADLVDARKIFSVLYRSNE